jgi:hypothetical protein
MARFCAARISLTVADASVVFALRQCGMATRDVRHYGDASLNFHSLRLRSAPFRERIAASSGQTKARHEERSREPKSKTKVASGATPGAVRFLRRRRLGPQARRCGAPEGLLSVGDENEMNGLASGANGKIPPRSVCGLTRQEIALERGGVLPESPRKPQSPTNPFCANLES